MKTFFRRLLNAGIDPQLTSQQTRHISFLNTLILLVLLLILLNFLFAFVELPHTRSVWIFLEVLVIHWILIAITLVVNYFNSFGFLFCAGAMGIAGYATINRAEKKLAEEHLRSERLLLNILPAPIAKRLKENSGIIADSYKNVTVLFADIVEFTKLSG